MVYYTTTWECGNYTGRRPVESENSPGVVGITRAGVEAEGRNVKIELKLKIKLKLG